MKRFISLASAMMAGAVMARYHHHNAETQVKVQETKANHHKKIVP
jgi:hypothetical protein